MSAPDPHRVPSEAAGERLDSWLARSLGEHSRAAIASMVDSGLVLVDGKPRPKSFRLRGGEEVVVHAAEAGVVEETAAEPRIAWENEDLAIVDKPAGLVVHPAPGHRRRTLVEILADKAGGAWQPLAVHRLDRDTSGLMIVAKRDQVRRELQGLIRRRAIRREYRALVEGRLSAKTGTIEAPIGRDPGARTRMAVGGERPREARTHFEVERQLSDFALVRATLETGRTHQIRAHFAAIGHPVAGDKAYGAGRPGVPPLGLERQFLHSARLAFRYSGDPEEIEEVSELPPDLVRAVHRASAEGDG
jgi:23S rRNA pseudouridine1911/1915/1917 synthase